MFHGLASKPGQVLQLQALGSLAEQLSPCWGSVTGLGSSEHPWRHLWDTSGEHRGQTPWLLFSSDSGLPHPLSITILSFVRGLAVTHLAISRWFGEKC